MIKNVQRRVAHPEGDDLHHNLQLRQALGKPLCELAVMEPIELYVEIRNLLLCVAELNYMILKSSAQGRGLM